MTRLRQSLPTFNDPLVQMTVKFSNSFCLVRRIWSPKDSGRQTEPWKKYLKPYPKGYQPEAGIIENLPRRRIEKSLFLFTTGVLSERSKISHTFQKTLLGQPTQKLRSIFSRLRSIPSKNIWTAPPVTVALSWSAPPARPFGSFLPSKHSCVRFPLD